MQHERPPRDEAEPAEEARPGIFARTALRAVDACLHRLQEVRDRIEPPPPEDARGERGRRGAAAEGKEAVRGPRPHSLLRRVLTVVLAFALGAGGATFMAYRGFAQMVASQEALIDFQQEEIEGLHKQEAINVKARAKAQGEAADLRKRLREVQMEIEERDARIDQLDQQVIALSRRLARPTFAAGTAKPGTVPRKTGTCVTGTTNASGNVLDCIDTFNRP